MTVPWWSSCTHHLQKKQPCGRESGRAVCPLLNTCLGAACIQVASLASLRVRELPCQHWPHRESNCYRETEKNILEMCSIICKCASSPLSDQMSYQAIGNAHKWTLSVSAVCFFFTITLIKVGYGGEKWASDWMHNSAIQHLGKPMWMHITVCFAWINYFRNENAFFSHSQHHTFLA